MASMLVPAVLVTVGMLLLLDNLGAIHFHRSWPIILIVLGSIKVLQSSASTEGHRERIVPITASPVAPAATQDPGIGASPTQAGEER